MKNDINKQISDIKRLILLNEQCGGDLPQCEEDLEDNNYLVYNPAERRAKGADCEDIQIIKDIKQIMVDGGIAAPRSDKSPNGNCYVEAKSKSGYGPSEGYNKFWNKTYLFVFANKLLSIVFTVDPSVPRTNVNNNKKYFQYMYTGNIKNSTTISTDKFIEFENFKYSGSFYEYDTNNEVKTSWDYKGKRIENLYPSIGKIKFVGGNPKVEF